MTPLLPDLPAALALSAPLAAPRSGAGAAAGEAGAFAALLGAAAEGEGAAEAVPIAPQLPVISASAGDAPPASLAAASSALSSLPPSEPPPAMRPVPLTIAAAQAMSQQARRPQLPRVDGNGLPPGGETVPHTLPAAQAAGPGHAVPSATVSKRRPAADAAAELDTPTIAAVEQPPVPANEGMALPGAPVLPVPKTPGGPRPRVAEASLADGAARTLPPPVAPLAVARPADHGKSAGREQPASAGSPLARPPVAGGNAAHQPAGGSLPESDERSPVPIPLLATASDTAVPPSAAMPLLSASPFGSHTPHAISSLSPALGAAASPSLLQVPPVPLPLPRPPLAGPSEPVAAAAAGRAPGSQSAGERDELRPAVARPQHPPHLAMPASLPAPRASGEPSPGLSAALSHLPPPAAPAWPVAPSLAASAPLMPAPAALLATEMPAPPGAAAPAALPLPLAVPLAAPMPGSIPASTPAPIIADAAAGRVAPVRQGADAGWAQEPNAAPQPPTPLDPAPAAASEPVAASPGSAARSEQTAPGPSPAAPATAPLPAPAPTPAPPLVAAAPAMPPLPAESSLRAPTEALPPLGLIGSIDQIADLRDGQRAARPDMLLRHGEFGMVALRIEGGAAQDWRALLSSRDPGFVPAVQAALAERAVAAAAETAAGFQHGQSSPSDQRYALSPGSGQGSPQPSLAHHAPGDEGRSSRSQHNPGTPGESEGDARTAADPGDQEAAQRRPDGRAHRDLFA